MASDFDNITPTIATVEDRAASQIGFAKPDYLGEVGPVGDSHVFSYGYKFYGTQKSADAITHWIHGGLFTPTGETELGNQTLTLPSGEVVQPGQTVALDISNQYFSVVRNATVR
ncbi:hypothetical protein [Corynebacterium silvaticum]|uniref:Uncharacterized protein n=1 Tax=Corynebacterium silvaticum TaxID=2320431 RepID=A0A7U5KA14_9CORY|nr:hypothetical protein [Corynebacterium silvaticum]ARU46995.2 hypothetical protein CBE74_11730 [Corynebacterium silvaticum]